MCFASYTGIQAGRPKCQENDLWDKSPVHSGDTLWVKKIRRNRSVSHRFRDKCVFAFYAEIQDGCQKWWENNFWENSPVESAYTLQVKNFVEKNATFLR